MGSGTLWHLSGDAPSAEVNWVRWQRKLLTIPRLTARWNLDLSRARVINPGDAYGDDDKASAINGSRPTPPSAMMLVHSSGSACVQQNTFFNARRHLSMSNAEDISGPGARDFGRDILALQSRLTGSISRTYLLPTRGGSAS